MKAIALAAYVVAALHAATPSALACCGAVALAVGTATGMRARDALRALAPLSAVFAFTAVFQVLYLQRGAVLLVLGPVTVTAGALYAVMRMVVALACMLVASIAFMRATPTGDLLGMLRWLLAPLRALGARTEGFMFALSVAFAFLPVLVGDFRQMKRAHEARAADFSGGVRQRLAAYARMFAPLVRGAFRRADTLAEAAVSRCLGCGASPTSLDVRRLAPRDYAFLTSTIAFAAMAIFL